MQGLITIGIMPEPLKFFEFHNHNMWEIIYYFQGTGTTTVGDIDVHFMPGTILCIPPGMTHREISKSGYRDYFLALETFNDQFNGTPCFQDNEDYDFLNILKQIYREYHMKQSNWKNITESLLRVLHHYMLAWSTEHKRVPLVESLKSLLLSNISNSSFCLEKALGEISLSPNHIRKVFKKETGRSLLHYLHEKRIAYARDLLSTKEVNRYKIKEIASLCGFDDPYYFSRLFKEKSGTSPEKWKPALKSYVHEPDKKCLSINS